MLRIVFFGTPQFAVPTLERLTVSGHQVTGVVTQPDRARGRGQRIVPAPVKDFAVLIVTNQGGGNAAGACDEAASALIALYTKGT